VWALTVLLLLLAACGSGGDDSPVGTQTPRPTLGASTQTPVPDGAAEAVATEDQDYTPLPGQALGPEDAAVTILMYGDFQCEVCAQYARDLEEVRARYPDDVRLLWRHLPDPRAHDKAALALQVSEAAAAQDAFWQMHDQLYTHQAEWIDLSPEEFRTVVSEYAATIGLDVEQFNAELDEDTYAPIVEAALRDAAALEIVGAPALLFNGVPYNGRDDRVGFEEGVRLILLDERHFDAPPEMTVDPTKTYRATLQTDKGDIVIELFPRDAPVAVNNFVFLARQGWYDGNTFYYVVPDLLAQTGDPSDTGRGGPGYTIPDEHDNGLAFDRAGLVAMAHPEGVEDGAGSIFFITLGPSEDWDGQYTIFGVVVDGINVVRSLTPRNPNDPINDPDPPPGDRVITIQIEAAE
jgi:cyclophilin family peptidyl-prolyl cis-trans isomerase/protein-disulfide isomerase